MKRSRRVYFESVEEPLANELDNLHLLSQKTSATTVSLELNTSSIDRNTQNQIMAMIETAVNKALTTASRSSGFQESSKLQRPQRSQRSQRDPNEGDEVVRDNRWNCDDIGFFDLNHESKLAAIEEALTHSTKNIYYKDVHVFVKRIKKMSIVLKIEQVCRNLFSCLRGTTLM